MNIYEKRKNEKVRKRTRESKNRERERERERVKEVGNKTEALKMNRRDCGLE